MGLKIGLCGVGQFGSQFVELFKAHPNVDDVYIADIFPDRLAEKAKELKVSTTFPSLDALCKSDCDCIAIFTQRWRHGPQAVQALKAGKHVYSAVPAAVTLEELQELVETVKSTGLIYMLGETSYYRPQTIYCRERFAKGDFGRFVYGEGQYHHDMAHFYTPYMHSGGPEWMRTASFPPMLYPTHSVSHILGVTFRRMTAVSCFGFADDHEDGIFDADLSQWGNTFSNETALFRTSDGGAGRINEFRRIGAGESRMTIMGTLGAYEEQAGTGVWTNLDFAEGYRKGGQIDYENTHKFAKRRQEDVSDIRHCKGVEITEANLGDLPREYIGKRHVGVSRMHPVERLPKEFVGLKNGHEGSHQFLVVDFIEAVRANRLPPNHVWIAARYNVPGIVAHESSKRDGELLTIPDYGLPPEDRARMEITYPLEP
ncbi:MAG: Gfo/Idh/MocA family oxidoreductase [Planctomycetota bacterium]